MTDPLEAMQWYEQRRRPRTDDRSDESFKSLRKFDLVERRPAPLNLTPAEQLRFLSEYCSGMQHVEATKDTHEVYIILSDWFETTRARTLSDAICLAAARWKEVNE
jgi:hypothetical protein